MIAAEDVQLLRIIDIHAEIALLRHHRSRRRRKACVQQHQACSQRSAAPLVPTHPHANEILRRLYSGSGRSPVRSASGAGSSMERAQAGAILR